MIIKYFWRTLCQSQLGLLGRLWNVSPFAQISTTATTTHFLSSWTSFVANLLGREKSCHFLIKIPLWLWAPRSSLGKRQPALALVTPQGHPAVALRHEEVPGVGSPHHLADFQEKPMVRLKPLAKAHPLGYTRKSHAQTFDELANWLAGSRSKPVAHGGDTKTCTAGPLFSDFCFFVGWTL